MADTRPVFFFDIDNCLYMRSCMVLEQQDKLIYEYIQDNLSVNRDEAQELHKNCLNSYGLIVEGLVQLHGVDALDFNKKVDDALPLERLLVPDPELRRLLERVDRTEVKLWLFTNAYVNHGKRVVKLLGIEDQFEGITFADYSTSPLRCKPHKDFFEKAMHEAGAAQPMQCYFVDDSAHNCRQAEELGWSVVHFLEQGFRVPENYVCKYRIQSLQELPLVYPQFFKH